MKAIISYLLIMLMLVPAAIANPSIRKRAKMECCKKMASPCHNKKEKQTCPSCISCPMAAVYILPQKPEIKKAFASICADHADLPQSKPSDFKASVWRPPNANPYC